MRPSTRDLARWEETLDAATFAEMIETAPPDLAREVGFGCTRRDGIVTGWASKVDVLAFNRALGFGIDWATTELQIDAAIDAFRAVGVPRAMVQIAPDAEPRGAIVPWLLDRDFYHHNNWVKLFRRAEPMRGPNGVQVDQVGPGQARTFGAIVGGAFGYPEPLYALCAGTMGRPRWSHYLAYVDHEPVAAAALYVMDDVGWLGWAGTRADHRGKGAQSALITRRISDAAAVGCRWVVVETAEPRPEKPAPSYRNMRRMGFEVAYLRPNFVKVFAAHPTTGAGATSSST